MNDYLGKQSGIVTVKFNLENFRLSESGVAALVKGRKSRVRKPKPGAFIKGPIPLVWMQTAAELPNKTAVTVGLAIWYLAGLKGKDTFVLSNLLIESFGITRQTKATVLKALEGAGLISIECRPRHNPVVTLIRDAGEAAADGLDCMSLRR